MIWRRFADAVWWWMFVTFFVLAPSLLVPERVYGNEVTTLDHVVKLRRDMSFCIVKKRFAISKKSSARYRRHVLTGEHLEKGEYIFIVHSPSVYGNGPPHHYHLVYHYEKSTDNFRFIKLVRKLKDSPQDVPLGSVGCWYQMPYQIAKAYAQSTLKERGYLKRTTKNVIAVQDTNYTFFSQGKYRTGTWSKGDAYKVALEPEQHPYMLVRSSHGLSWTKKRTYLVTAEWESNVQRVTERDRQKRSLWKISIGAYVLFGIVFLALPLTRAMGGAAVLGVAKTFRYFWWLWILSGWFLIKYLTENTDQLWVLGDDPRNTTSNLYGYFGVFFIVPLPFFLYVAGLMIYERIVAQKARSVARSALPDDLEKEADYHSVRRYIDENENDDHNARQSYLERKRIEALSEELKAKQEAYDKLVEAARAREHAREKDRPRR